MTDHSGHRSRLKTQYIESEGKGFPPHKLLELLLFYAIPRRDTNGIAHELIQRFGSVEGVLDASMEQLCQINGISESSALLIKLVGRLGKEGASHKKKEAVLFRTYDDIGAYCWQKLCAISTERVLALYMDSGGRLLKSEYVCDGGANSALFNPRDIVSRAISLNATAVALGHNHPGGSAIPSSFDLDTTANIRTLLDVAGIELIEHYIVANDGICRVMEKMENTPTKNIKRYFDMNGDQKRG